LVALSRSSCAILLAAALCGCSTVRFAYENADAYMRWRVGMFLDLEGDEADEMHDRIDQFHAWHRRNALPKYAALAHEASQRVGRGLSRADLVWGYDSVRTQARESLSKAAELLAPLLDRLTPEQVAQIERRIAEENRQFRRDYLQGTESERRARRARSAVNRLEDWVGKLTPAQRQRVRDYAARAPLVDEMRERDRLRLQHDVMAIVRARQAKAKLAQRVAHWELGREAAFAAALEQSREQYFAMLLDVERTLEPEQRRRLLGQLRRYAEDFEALAAR
jgi:hypothetical protein